MTGVKDFITMTWVVDGHFGFLYVGGGGMLLLMDCQFTTKFELRVTKISVLKFLNILCRYLKTVSYIVKSENLRIRSVEQQN